jgi:Icc protein
MTSPLRLLQISDSHFTAPGRTLLGVDTRDSLDALLARACAQPVDAVIASGDLAHDPEPAVYRRFETALRNHWSGPVLYLPGNHDLTAPLQATLGTRQNLGLGAWEVLAFDSHEDHSVGSAFGREEREALAERIRLSPAQFLLLACHHPPLPVGCPWLDKDCIPAGRELLESCAADPRVRGLVFGHVHQAFEAAVGAVKVLGTPSTCFQFEPGSARFSIDRSPATGVPGYRWLELYDDGTLRTEVARMTGYALNIDTSDRS